MAYVAVPTVDMKWVEPCMKEIVENARGNAGSGWLQPSSGAMKSDAECLRG